MACLRGRRCRSRPLLSCYRRRRIAAWGRHGVCGLCRHRGLRHSSRWCHRSLRRRAGRRLCAALDVLLDAPPLQRLQLQLIGKVLPILEDLADVHGSHPHAPGPGRCCVLAQPKPLKPPRELRRDGILRLRRCRQLRLCLLAATSRRRYFGRLASAGRHRRNAAAGIGARVPPQSFQELAADAARLVVVATGIDRDEERRPAFDHVI
mmetsp:Transcript_77267/g.165658  ORF Transcript_77267/g.165658 Transcript_77267/m.165658 type:complete len:207 (-) Transcript_77267:52-672(-)